MTDYNILTPEGKKKLEAELKGLKTNKRREISERIELAKEHGDLSENAEYQEAREEQAFVEGRILEIENIFKNAEVVESSKTDQVQVGSKVVLATAGQDREFTLVGSHEGNPAQGLLSCDSPLGQAILGKKAGDEVQVETPRGFTKYKIEKVE